MKPFFSIIIPYYSNKKVLIDYLKTLEKSTFKDFEVIIVNDSEKPLILGNFSFSYNIVNNPQNMGYAQSLNIGFSYSKGEFLILSNSDILLDKNSLKMIYQYVVKYGNIYSIFQPALFSLENNFDPFCKRYLPKKWNFLFFAFKWERFNLFFKYFYNTLKMEEIECGKGAFIIVEKNIFNHLGKCSTDYWMFWEDVDFFKKAKIFGVKTLFIPIKIIHLGGETVKRLQLKANLGELKARAIYFKKFHHIPKKILFLFELLGNIPIFFFHLCQFKIKLANYYVKYIKNVLKLLK